MTGDVVSARSSARFAFIAAITRAIRRRRRGRYRLVFQIGGPTHTDTRLAKLTMGLWLPCASSCSSSLLPFPKGAHSSQTPNRKTPRNKTLPICSGMPWKIMFLTRHSCFSASSALMGSAQYSYYNYTPTRPHSSMAGQKLHLNGAGIGTRRTRTGGLLEMDGLHRTRATGPTLADSTYPLSVIAS